MTTSTLSKLQEAVINQLGYSEDDYLDESSCCYDELHCTLQDITNHGIDGGFGSFIYHSDTVKFFDDNRDLILTALTTFSHELGESSIDIVKGFRCLNGDYDDEAEQVLMNLPCDDGTQVKNALAWFAAEHVAQELS